MLSGLASASELTVFGPENFSRGTGSPTVVERSFTVANPTVPYTVEIVNGGLQDNTDTAEYVSSSEIYLNGTRIAGVQNFNQQVQSLHVPVMLGASNTLRIELRGKPGGQLSLAIIRDANTPPTADAGPDQTLPVGETARLNGAASSDLDGDPLTFQWQLTEAPAQSQAILLNPATMTPSLTLDWAGHYVADLVVNDGFNDSVADHVSIDTANSAPVADAGEDHTAFVGGTVTLDGSGSSDIDRDPLTYRWRLLEKPGGSQSSLTDPSAILTDLLIDRPGRYIAELVVNDGELDSEPDPVIVDTINSAPVASAGLDQNAS